MLSVVASWDRETGKSLIHLVLDSAASEPAQRRAQVAAKVAELETQLDSDRFEVICSVVRNLEDFRQTDPRFYEASGP